ncbi:MAG: ABC transporter substrate-binding protein [Candidatus Binatia bacterium]
MRQRRFKKNSWLLFAMVLFPLLGFLSKATAQDAHTANLVERARKEGAVIWYTSMNLEDAKKMVDAFSKKYPFLRIDFFRANSAKLLNRVLTETRAGRYLFDVLALSGFEIHQVVKSGLLQPYVSPESKAYPELFKDAKGFWTDYFDSYAVVGYNTKLIPKGQQPKDWDDLLDPQWKGKLLMDFEDVRWYATMLDRWGREKGERYMRALAKQGMPFRRGASLISQLVVAGEAPMGMVNAHTTERIKDRGGPVDWVRTSDPIVVSLHPIGLAFKPVHPNAGKLLIDFVLSKEGQQVIVDVGRTSPRPGMDPRVDPSKLKLFPTRPELAERYQQFEQEYKEIFGH